MRTLGKIIAAAGLGVALGVSGLAESSASAMPIGAAVIAADAAVASVPLEHVQYYPYGYGYGYPYAYGYPCVFPYRCGYGYGRGYYGGGFYGRGFRGGYGGRGFGGGRGRR